MNGEYLFLRRFAASQEENSTRQERSATEAYKNLKSFQTLLFCIKNTIYYVI